MAERITNGAVRGKKISLLLNEQAVEAYEGETIATIVLAQGIRIFSLDRLSAPRGPFCGMGVCHDCLVTVIGTSAAEPRKVRACVTPATAGIHVILPGQVKS